MASTTTNLGLYKPAIGDDISVTDIGTKFNDNWDALDEAAGGSVTNARLLINADLEMNENSLTETKSVRFQNQSSAPTGTYSLYTKGTDGDLYFRDGQNREIRVSAGGALDITAAEGIGGDYAADGDALASYTSASNQFNLLQDSGGNQAASLDVGTIKQRTLSAGASRYVSLTVPAGITSSYTWSWPTALPGSTSVLTLTAAGQAATTRDLSIDTLTTAGAVTVGGNTSFSGDLDGVDATFTGDLLSDTGHFTNGVFAGSTSALQDVTVNDITVSGTVDADDITPTGGTLAVTGAQTISSTLAVTGAATFSSDLTVTGNLQGDAGLTVAGGLNVSGGLDLTGGLEVGGNTTMGTLGVGGATVVSGTLTTTDDITVTGDIDVSGNVRYGEQTLIIPQASATVTAGDNATFSISTWGLAAASGDQGRVSFPLYLPVGTRIKTVRVNMQNFSPSTDTWSVSLLRQANTSTTQTTITSDSSSGSDTVTLSSIDHVMLDNNAYHIRVTLDANPTNDLTILQVAVDYDRP